MWAGGEVVLVETLAVTIVGFAFGMWVGAFEREVSALVAPYAGVGL